MIRIGLIDRDAIRTIPYKELRLKEGVSEEEARAAMDAPIEKRRILVSGDHEDSLYEWYTVAEFEHRNLTAGEFARILDLHAEKNSDRLFEYSAQQLMLAFQLTAKGWNAEYVGTEFGREAFDIVPLPIQTAIGLEVVKAARVTVVEQGNSPAP